MDKALLADTLAVIHLAYCAFIVLGLVAILIGILRRWAWVRNFWFRALHLLAILIVAVEEVLQVQCPLTVWERQLRREAGQTLSDASFMAQLANDVLFRPLPQWVFATAHITFAALVLLTFVFARPRWPWRK